MRIRKSEFSVTAQYEGGVVMHEFMKVDDLRERHAKVKDSLL